MWLIVISCILWWLLISIKHYLWYINWHNVKWEKIFHYWYVPIESISRHFPQWSLRYCRVLGTKTQLFSWDIIFIILQQPSFGDEQRLPEKSRVANSARLRQRLLTAENPRHRLKWMWWVCLISLNIYVYIYILHYIQYTIIYITCVCYHQFRWIKTSGRPDSVHIFPIAIVFFLKFATSILNLDKSWWAPRSRNLGCSPMWQVPKFKSGERMWKLPWNIYPTI